MFGKKAAPAAEPTILGRGAVIEGTVRASGPIQVDGEVEGTLLVDGHVSIGPNGAVVGELVADEIVVGGRVEGKIVARSHLHVAQGGSVRGEVRYGSLQIDRGGMIDGNTGRADEPSKSVSVAGPSQAPAGLPQVAG